MVKNVFFLIRSSLTKDIHLSAKTINTPGGNNIAFPENYKVPSVFRAFLILKFEVLTDYLKLLFIIIIIIFFLLML